MTTIERILFPTDFTNRAERAFARAASLADAFGAELHVLNIVVPTETSLADPMGHLSLKKESIDTWSDAYRLSNGDAGKIVHAQVRIASPPVGILHYAESHEIDLIVMATHGRKGLDHLLLGSVAEEVVRRAGCPVLTIRNADAAANAPDWKRILVPVDFSESSAMIVKYAKELAIEYGAQLDLLHVIEEAVFPTIYGVDPIAVAGPQVIERSKESLNELIQTTGEPDVPFEIHVAVGHPVKEIVDFAEGRGLDLITIATHGLTGLQRLLIGSVTEKVVRLAPCPVLTLKSFGKVLLAGESEAVRGEVL